MTVVKHGSIFNTGSFRCKMFQVGVVGRDYPFHLFLIEGFQDCFGYSPSQHGFCTGAEFIDQDQGIFSVLIKKEVRGSGLLFLEKRRKVFGGAIGLKRPVNTKEDDVVTKASAHVREKDAIARYAAGLIRDDDIVNHSNDVYILADSSKFEQVFAVTFTKLKGKCIITDRLDNDLYRKHAIVKEVNK